jgi:O-antigen/teichoic acid export membrane protein
MIGFNYAAALISFTINFWLAHRWGAETFGELSYGIVVSNLLNTFVVFGMDRTLVRDLVQSKTPANVIVGSLHFKFLLSCVGIPVAIGILYFTGLKTEALITSGLCCVWGAATAMTPQAWFDFKRHMHLQAVLVFLEKLIYSIIVTVVVLFTVIGERPYSVALCLALTGCAGVSFQCFVMWRRARENYTGITGEVSRLFHENMPVALAAFGNLGMTHVNQLVLEQVEGFKVLAYYSIAAQMVRITQMFLAQVCRLFAPRIARLTDASHKQPDLMKSFLQIQLLSLTAATVISLSIAVIGTVAIRLFLPEFLQAIPILYVLCVWTAIYGTALSSNYFLLGFRRQKSYFVITIATGCLSVVAGYFVVPQFGGMGVAMTLLCTHAISIACQNFFVFQEIRIRMKEGLAE